MNYALIENGIVTNIIWLYSSNAFEFPNAVPMNDYPVAIGDTYENNTFYRNGERLLTIVEQLQQRNIELCTTISELDTALLEQTYNNLTGGV